MAGVLKKTGERQVASKIDDVRSDHKNRYFWVRDKLAKTDIVLDAGCGVGYGSKILAENCESVFAYDISKLAIEFANKHWRNPNIVFSQSDLHFTEYKAGVADKVVAFEILEHLAIPELFIKQAYDALKSKGIMFVSVPNKEELPHSVTLNPFHFRHYSFDEVIELFRNWGFELKSYAFQDHDEIFEGESGRFIILELQKIEAASSLDKELDFESSVKNLVDEIHRRAEAISYLKRELESKTEQSEKRASLIRKLRDECEEQKRQVDIITAKLSSYEKFSNHFSKTVEAQMRGVIEKLHRQLECSNAEVLKLASDLAKFKTISEQLTEERSDVVDSKLSEARARNDVLNATISSQKREYEQKLSLESYKNCKLEETLNSKNAELASKLKHESERNDLLIKQLAEQQENHQEALTDLRCENDKLVRALEVSQLQFEARLNEKQDKEEALHIEMERKNDEHVKAIEVALNRVHKVEKEQDDIINETIVTIDELKLEVKIHKKELALEREKCAEVKELLDEAETKIQNLYFINEYYQKEVESNSVLIDEKNKRIKNTEEKLRKLSAVESKLTASCTQLKNETSQLVKQHKINLKRISAYQNAERFLKSKISRLLDIVDRNAEKEKAFKQRMSEDKARVASIEKAKAAEIAHLKSELASNAKKTPIILSQCMTKNYIASADDNIIFAIRRYFKELGLKRCIISSPLFDSEWYSASFEDVKESGLSPELHYLRIGAGLGRPPSEHFDGERYLKENRDVATGFTNPLLHYEMLGRSEGRKIYPFRD